MKGLQKAIMRTPHLMTSKVGMAKKSNDPEFDEYNRHFTAMEGAAEQLLKDSKIFADAVNDMLKSGHQFAVHFAALFSPFTGEYNLDSKHPNAAGTIGNADVYQSEMQELQAVLAPEIELINARIISPVKELQGVMKLIRKNITKRDHKLMDFDRFNNSLTKLRDKKEKSLSDEKNLFKLEQDFEVAMNEYETFNNALKTDMPTFMRLATQFIDPLFHSFYYMQLNIFYLMLEKLNGFCEKRYNVAGNSHEIINDYEANRGDAREQVEALSVTKRYISSAKVLGRGLGAGQTGLNRAPSATSSLNSSSLGPSRSNTVSSANTLGSKYGSLASKKGAAPPPPSALAAHPPPPYSSASGAATGFAAAKKGPPPPPPLKSKPSYSKPVVYVTALYDYDAQADGDLSFRAGDRIELVQKSDSAEDWWTGKINGHQGVFPGNYVQE